MTMTLDRPPVVRHPAGAVMALAPRVGTSIEPAADGVGLHIVSALLDRTLSVPEPGIAQVVIDLATTPDSIGGLLAGYAARPGATTMHLARLRLLVEQLRKLGVLDVVLVAEGREVARLFGGGITAVEDPREPASGIFAVSTKAVLTVADGWLVAQSGRSDLKVRLRAADLAELLAGTPAAGAAEATQAPGPGDAALDFGRLTGTQRRLATLLLAARLLEPAGAPAQTLEDMWSAADLWVHRRATEPLAVDGYGGTYRFGSPPEPYGRPAAAETISLPVPDPDRLRAEDPPFAVVSEERRSHRSYATVPMTLPMLGELLYRSARVRHLRKDPHGFEVVDRPYPTGGAVSETEIYIAAVGPGDVPAGLWRFAADRFALDKVAAGGPELDRVVADTTRVCPPGQASGVAVLLTTRFERLMWKYETMAYALAMKNVGCLTQQIYLSATAMGLGCCAIGGCSGDRFAVVAGLDPRAEGLVGSILVGVPAPDGPDGPFQRISGTGVPAADGARS